jgi:hypothetical protein
MIVFPNPVKTCLDDTRERVNLLCGRNVTDEDIIKQLGSSANTVNSSSIGVLGAEFAWIKRRRPFFNVHPPVLRGLANTSLSIKPCSIPMSVVHDIGIICVKFPTVVSHKLLTGVSHFYLTIANTLIDVVRQTIVTKKSVGIGYHTRDAMFHITCPMDEDFESANSRLFEDSVEQSDFEVSQRHYISRIALGVMLLAADPGFIEPVLLRRDLGKIDDKQKLAERARRNGVIGYEIGSNMEVSPHFRRPHFAIRWTGKGSTIPRLVTVKGAIIHKSQLEVPTGYELDNNV